MAKKKPSKKKPAKKRTKKATKPKRKTPERRAIDAAQDRVSMLKHLVAAAVQLQAAGTKAQKSKAPKNCISAMKTAREKVQRAIRACD